MKGLIMMFMKRTICCLLASVMVFSLIACSGKKPQQNHSNRTNNNTSTVKEDSASLSKDKLKSIASDLNDAEEYTDSIAAILLQKWSTDSYFAYFFDKVKFNSSTIYSRKEDYVNVHTYREKAEQILEQVKALLEPNGTGDSYNAAKKYYLALTNYLELVSEYPSGYSLVTYSSAVSDRQNECRTCRLDMDFYLD